MRTRNDLVSGMLTFATLLRTEYAVPAGHTQAHEALRGLEAVGIDDAQRARYALRATFCSKQEELERFDRAFEAFFGGLPRGIAQPRASAVSSDDAQIDRGPVRRREPVAENTGGNAWQTLRARYSPAACETSEAPAISTAGLAEMLADASRLIAALHLGRSRRWKPHIRGMRFDLRRTLRASLQTGGDPVRLRTLGHPLRNPRIVLLLDGSRSMSEHTPGLLQFAYALCRRSNRASVLVFSTALRDITRDLRKAPHETIQPLQPLGEAWGGGTRLGACLLEFVRTRGSRLDRDTLAIVASDGLEVGDGAQLERAMHDLHRRCAGIIWLNPHAGAPGFSPSARGMQIALPYVSALLDAGDLHTLGASARRLRR